MKYYKLIAGNWPNHSHAIYKSISSDKYSLVKITVDNGSSWLSETSWINLESSNVIELTKDEVFLELV